MQGYKEVRKRGVLGWFFLILFAAWNLIMILMLVFGVMGVGDAVNQTVETSPASALIDEETAYAAASAGAAIGITALVIIWALGSVILGLPVLMTRGRTTLVPLK